MNFVRWWFTNENPFFFFFFWYQIWADRSVFLNIGYDYRTTKKIWYIHSHVKSNNKITFKNYKLFSGIYWTETILRTSPFDKVYFSKLFSYAAYNHVSNT